MKVSVILDDADAERFQAYCKKNGFKKSTLICRLIREHLENENFSVQTELDLVGQRVAKKDRIG